MPFMCECRGPCRRAIDIRPETYRELRLMGTVLTPDCAEREDRFVLYEWNAHCVVALSIGSRMRPPDHPTVSL
jgi:hypothetical protein